MTNVEYTSDRVAVVHGRWDEIRDYTQAGLISFECSECGRLCDTLYRYCPHCGAKMGEYVVGETAPDLVNVVRCRDCLCFHRNVHDRGDDSYCSSINCEVRDYDYCSRAIRRPDRRRTNNGKGHHTS